MSRVLWRGSSSTGDPYLVAVQPSDAGGKPVVIAPGATGTIQVTITPTGAKGSEVTGVLNLVSPPSAPADAFDTSGDVLATIPYSYTVS